MVAVLTFNRPENRNALDITMRMELKELLPEIRAGTNHFVGW